ncbi:lyase family protein [Micromonospora andamanensis]|uniref:argininosuccinate lyase n=1 Tax=Micromonospora andamanensis TaxID=1287068 RepID=A0ABQ4HTF2_9ACTN|nr:lyase family protein [Micromonospora andamanensis]GIJ08908.1 argininosuccinate lyase [Micromonospora andamanensis]
MNGPLSSPGTGRIASPLAGKAQRLCYEASDPVADRAILRLIAQVDRAHLVMLAERGIIAGGKAARLLRTVRDIEAEGFAPVLSLPRPRGIYLAYEEAVTRRCGPDVGGLLHTGRSRNDLNATTTLLGLRDRGSDVVAEGGRLVTALLASAGRHLDDVMAIHTHYQPAMPITYGYYLTGVALALLRGLDRMMACLRAIRRCPLGAHAVAGTDLELDTERTAALLGFESGPLHAVDAIASRDASLDALGVAANLAVTVSRLAADLQLWSSSEVHYVHFPDWLVGGSSALPQKRNAFVLEHLKARPTRVLGAWVTATSAIRSAPFTNSIEVGTEAMAPVAPALRTTRDVLALAALVVAGARPRPATMEPAAARGFVEATAVTNDLVRQGVPFREAHRRVGAAVLRAVDDGAAWPPEGLARIDPRTAADRARFGGGPGSRAETLAAAWALRHRLRADLHDLRRRWAEAAVALGAASEAVCRG